MPVTPCACALSIFATMAPPSHTYLTKTVTIFQSGMRQSHAHAAVELPGQSLTRRQKGDAQHLLRGADFAEEAVGALQGLAVPELDELGVRG